MLLYVAFVFFLMTICGWLFLLVDMFEMRLGQFSWINLKGEKRDWLVVQLVIATMVGGQMDYKGRCGIHQICT